MEEQMCPECGFPIDEGNESQPVCPRCGADPAEHHDSATSATSGFPSMRLEQFLETFRPAPVITPGNNLIH
jgi:ribosomal protein L37E